MTLLAPRPTPGADESSLVLPDGAERPIPTPHVLFREARQRRRRRWFLTGLSLVVLVGAALGLAMIGRGGPDGTSSAGRSGDESRPGAPPASGNSAVPPVTLGAGATSIYFSSSERGWIATGCNRYCLESRPALITTDNGGRTWRQLATPNIGSVPSSGVIWFSLGAKVEVRFLNRWRGWYLQAGQLWTTGDGGSAWRLSKTTGLVTDLTTAGDTAWMLSTDCASPVQLSCSTLRLFRWSPTDTTWTPVSRRFPSGLAGPTDIALTPAGNAVYVSARDGAFRVAANGAVTRVSNACRPIRGFPGSQLVGICNVGDDASNSTFALSDDNGTQWTPSVVGPPHIPGRLEWSGPALTNGTGIIWYVVGGSTLWRTTVTGKVWTLAYRTPVGSTDELYPLLFANQSTGYMAESGSAGARLLRTTDGGLNWNPVSVS